MSISINRIYSMFRLLLLVTILYLFLYNPIFLALGIGCIKPLLAIAVIYAFINNRVFKLLVQFKYEAIFTFIIIIYTLFTILRSNNLGVLLLPYQHFIWFLESIFLSVVIVIWFRKEFEQHGWEKLVVITGFIASLISLVLILNPGWNEFVRTSLISDSLVEDYKSWFRGFGIAEGLSGSYGVIQGIIVGISLYTMRCHVLYVVPVLPLLISIAFNARTGFVAVIYSFMLLIAQRRYNRRLVATVLVISLIIGYVLNSEVEYIHYDINTIKWAMSSFDQTGDFLSGSSDGKTVFDTLFGEYFFYPDSAMGLLLGDVIIPFHDAKHSDVGYINEVMFGGIVYLLLLLSFLAYMHIRLSKKSTDKFYPIFFLVVLLIFNIKTTCLFIPNGVFRLFVLYYVLIITSSRLWPIKCPSN